MYRFLTQILIAFSGLISFQAWAQFHPMLDDFRVFEYQGNVYLSWTISRGETCNGILIERSANNQHFQVVGDIAGICGSADFAQSYEWIDRAPLPNSTNYYRLELGTFGPSESVSIEYVLLPQNGYQVRPNPVRENARIHFSNSSGKEHFMEVYDLSGRPVQASSTFSGEFQLDAQDMSAGLYIFVIRTADGQSSISGKFSVAR